jgi:dinuclear metal center YbgI/SA1388 family protein
VKSATAGEVVEILHRRYPPETAQEWDRVGVVLGNLAGQAQRIYFAVDVLPETVAEAIEWGADFVISHHPLFLFELVEPAPGESPTPMAPWKSQIASQLEVSGAVLLTLHTNADVAHPGVSDALAQALGLVNVVAMPEGLGRVGEVARPVPLQKFVEHISRSIPVGVNGVRATGDPQQLIKRVALCGGSGDDRFEIVQGLGVDAYLTADLKHHRVSEALAGGAPVLIDGGHFATEWPWLEQAARLLAEDLSECGYAQPEMKISEISTDPWRVR